MAGRIGDGFVTMKPDADLVAAFRRGGGGDKPVVGGLKVCWDTDRDRAVDTDPGRPGHHGGGRHFRGRPDEHVEAIGGYVEADFDEVYIGQVGPDQRQFFDAYRREVLPALQDVAHAA